MADLVYPPVITAVKGLFRSLGLTFPVSGAEHIPRSGGAVLASNHVSYLDFMFVGFAAQPAQRLVRFMAKDAVFKNPVSRAADARHEAHPGGPRGRGRVLPVAP